MPDFMNKNKTAWITFFLSDELKARIAQAIGQDVPEDAHLTMAYLGPLELIHSVDELKYIFEEFVKYHNIVNGSISGIGQFLSKDGAETSEVLLFDGSDIEKFRYRLVEDLGIYGFPVGTTYGFIPHITISTNGKELTLTEPIKNVSLQTLSLVLGDDVFSTDLSGLRMGKAGARTNKKDKEDVQQGHDIFVKLGATCKADHSEKPKKNMPIITNDNILPKKLTDAITQAVKNGFNQPKKNILDLPVSNAFKAISKNDTELVVGNHIFLYGDENHRDLEGIASDVKNGDGSKGEFFTKSTEYASDFTEVVGRLPVDFEHGMKPGGANDPDRNDILGYVNWDTAKATPDGLWVERVLNRSNEYVRLLEPLIEAGLVGSSSEPVQEEIKKAANGEILKWPLIRDAITVTPMEPRMILGGNSLSVENEKLLKSYYKSIPVVNNTKTKLELLQLQVKNRKILSER